jgi:fatty-acyl-CoA synthase
MLNEIAREATYIRSVGRTLWRMRHVKPDSPITIGRLIEDLARRMPHNPAILYEEDTLDYRALNQRSNRFANWARGLGVSRGDMIGLLMENRPDYIAAWIGLTKLGAVCSLFNTNLRGPALAHSLRVANARHLIVGSELIEAFAEVRQDLDQPPVPWVLDGTQGGEDLGTALSAAGTGDGIDGALRAKDLALYIFTSGTTGMPKAAKISHLRLLFMMYGFAGALNAKPSDRMYNVLPLYHSAGGICALGPALTTGGSVVIRRKFSVHEFWSDVHRYRPTFFQYIGELCRYLLNAPTSAHEQDHSLRAITGNGLRPEIWQTFQSRFRIPKIVEFYGATEGNVSMLNYDGRLGAVGRIPSYMRSLMPVRIVRFDVEREMPIRNADGFCIECESDEAGEAIGRISSDPRQRFEGYSREEDTQKKILRDVFEKGDAWFRTGDLLKRDAYGYFYFVDRIGDTFRFKGENVSTNEVAEALGVIEGIKEANVYGISIPGMDGRVGMAALSVAPGFRLDGLAAQLAGTLPAYAQPLFIRLRPELEITGTFKLRKVDLVQEGADPARIDDPLYVLKEDRYVPLDAQYYADICAGRIRL